MEGDLKASARPCMPYDERHGMIGWGLQDDTYLVLLTSKRKEETLLVNKVVEILGQKCYFGVKFDYYYGRYYMHVGCFGANMEVKG